MADIRDSKNWGFETKQLHIGQEQADPVTDARAVQCVIVLDRKSTRLNSSHN